MGQFTPKSEGVPSAGEARDQDLHFLKPFARLRLRRRGVSRLSHGKLQSKAHLVLTPVMLHWRQLLTSGLKINSAGSQGASQTAMLSFRHSGSTSLPVALSVDMEVLVYVRSHMRV